MSESKTDATRGREGEFMDGAAGGASGSEPGARGVTDPKKRRWSKFTRYVAEHPEIKGFGWILFGLAIAFGIQVGIGVTERGLPLVKALRWAAVVAPMWVLSGIIFGSLFAIPLILWSRWRSRK